MSVDIRKGKTKKMVAKEITYEQEPVSEDSTEIVPRDK